MRYGYARVSTKGQQREGNSLHDQQQNLRAAGAEEIYFDSFTGTTMDRPQFTALLNRLQSGDELMVTKLDRLARSATKGVECIRSLAEKGVAVNILNMGRIDDTSVGKLVLTIMMAFAEYERDMIVERTQAGKAIARMQPDFHEGRPRKYTEKQLAHALELLNDHSYTQVESMTGISKSTLIRAKRKEKRIER